MNELGVKIVWVGREKKLWAGVLKELKAAQELTKNNKVLTLNMCVNYGGRAEMVDVAAAIAKDAIRKKIRPDSLTEKSINKYLYSPAMSDVDLFLRSSGEQRTSNFLMWQSAYAEMVFLDVLWPDADRRTLWKAIEIYAERERRFGKA
jgi:undecaprenyl diphosphate synthase